MWKRKKEQIGDGQVVGSAEAQVRRATKVWMGTDHRLPSQPARGYAGNRDLWVAQQDSQKFTATVSGAAQDGNADHATPSFCTPTWG